MNININQGNTQENITSEIILKLYQIATAAGNSVTLSGNLYSPRGYVNQVDYLNTQFAPNLTITVPDSGKYIYFEDTAVQSALLNASIGDGIGITMTVAANATLTSDTFYGNTDITTFNEFKYFTKANTTPPNDLFRNCSNLTSIDLSNCTTVSGAQFYGCNNLVLDVKDLSNITNFNSDSFSGCTIKGGILKAPANYVHPYFLRGVVFDGLTGLDFSDGHLTSIGSWIQGISGMTFFKFPKTLTSISQLQRFDENTKQFFYGLDNIITINNVAIARPNVQNPIGLLQYEGPNNILTNSGTWNEVCSFHSLFFPKIKTTKSMSGTGNYGPAGGFFMNAVWGENARVVGNLVYFKDITSFGLGTFWKSTITNLVINNTAVPTYDTTNLGSYSDKSYYTEISSLFGNALMTTVWVPQSAVSDYQNSPLFSGMTIKSIDLKTNGVDYDLPRFATYADWEAAYNASVANGTESPVGLIEEYM